MPVEIEVKNYRSYRDELFSYDGISFATINGENGAGKSSLFMDAMLDALFEGPREGDRTGWICNDPDARSGSIKLARFTSATKLYRVTRAPHKERQGDAESLRVCGRELAEPQRGDNIRDTQAIIENTIGMDSLTLKATGLIMQDQYGLFLQADKADRMAILGNILGLGIYDRMESMAANRAADACNRELRRVADLPEETGRSDAGQGNGRGGDEQDGRRKGQRGSRQGHPHKGHERGADKARHCQAGAEAVGKTRQRARLLDCGEERERQRAGCLQSADFRCAGSPR